MTTSLSELGMIKAIAAGQLDRETAKLRELAEKHRTFSAVLKEVEREMLNTTRLVNKYEQILEIA